MRDVFNKALEYHGLSEVKGKDISNPTILKWMQWALNWYRGDDSELAWCGIFMGIVFREAGYEHLIPKHFYRARSWMTVGQSIDLKDAEQGDIVVYWRGVRDDGTSGHVHLYFTQTENTVRGLGGNQGDMVSIAAYSKSKILSVIRPNYIRTKSINKLGFLDKVILRLTRGK